MGSLGRGEKGMTHLAYPRAAVLGCGPAGLISAEALDRKGWKVQIFSRKSPSMITGAQYLHAALPGITNIAPDGMINFVKRGHRDGYAQKVYGDPKAPCSWDIFEEGEVPAWSMVKTYHLLWRKWGSLVHHVDLNRAAIPLLQRQHDLVVSTIPAWKLCNGTHQFKEANIWIRDQAEFQSSGRNEIIYCGDLTVPWYRTSSIFGHESTEYTKPVMNCRRGKKPVSTDCDCLPGVVRAGRFGQWKKGVLIHHVWEEMNSAVFSL